MLRCGRLLTRLLLPVMLLAASGCAPIETEGVLQDVYKDPSGPSSVPSRQSSVTLSPPQDRSIDDTAY